jgi:hypothetical protein
MRWGIAFALAFVMGCSSPSPGGDDGEEAPTCGTPPVLAVPIAIARDSGEPLHWSSARCIQVTYAGLTAAQVTDVAYAVDAWAAIGCRSLCFDGPTESDATLEGADGRLHVTTATKFPASSTVVYFASSGRIRGALIDLTATPVRGELVRQLGLNLGLDRAAPGVDSVLAPGYPLGATTTPTASDAEALCALYGKPPLCD